MRRRKQNIMDTIPTNPEVKIDKREKDQFIKRVNEVIAEVETDVGSAHLFEPMSDVIRRRHINDEIREEISAALFTEYLIIRKHASMRYALLRQLEILDDREQDNISKYEHEERFEESFFDAAKGLLKEIYEEVQL